MGLLPENGGLASEFIDRGIPVGGALGAQLQKSTSSDYDTEWLTKPYVDVRDYGAVGDGTTDDTAAFEAAIAAANGKEIWLGSNTYVITPITSTLNIRMRGRGATIKAHSSATGTLFSPSGDLRLEGIKFDGSNLVGLQRLLSVGITGDEKNDVVDCEFKNLSSDTYATAITVNFCAYANIERCYFNSIKALANGTVGDGNGPVRCVQFGYSIKLGRVVNCTFEDINNRTAGGSFAWEDADAIYINPGSGTSQTIQVSGCLFKNVGKRAVKMQSKIGCVCTVEDCIVESNYTGTSDLITDEGNAMYSAFSLYGGQLILSNCRVKGGAVGYFVDVDINTSEALEIRGCDYRPEYHHYANESTTQGILIKTTATGLRRVVISDSSFVNCWMGATIDHGGAVDIDDCFFLQQNHGIETICDYVGLRGTTIRFLNDEAAVNNPYGIYLSNGLVSAIINGNTFDGLADGVYLADQSSTFQLVVTNNIFTGLTRNIFSNFGPEGSPGVYFNNNNPNQVEIVSTTQTLTDGATVNWNAFLGRSAVVTLGGNRTLGKPTNIYAGQTLALRVKQDGTGSRTLGYHADFQWAGGTPPTLSTDPNAVDVISFLVDDQGGTLKLLGSAVQDFS